MTGARRFVVILNQEEQYTLWPEDGSIPEGWQPTGFGGTQEECLAHVDEVWTDMRPLSLRLHMDEQVR